MELFEVSHLDVCHKRLPEQGPRYGQSEEQGRFEADLFGVNGSPTRKNPLSTVASTAGLCTNPPGFTSRL